MAKAEPKTDPRPPRPDAVRIPLSYIGEGKLKDIADPVLDIAEPLLQVDKPNGERAYSRRCQDFRFVTRDEKDGVFFGDGHPLKGRPRYRWESHGDKGVMIGFLIPEAKENPSGS